MASAEVTTLVNGKVFASVNNQDLYQGHYLGLAEVTASLMPRSQPLSMPRSMLRSCLDQHSAASFNPQSLLKSTTCCHGQCLGPHQGLDLVKQRSRLNLAASVNLGSAEVNALLPQSTSQYTLRFCLGLSEAMPRSMLRSLLGSCPSSSFPRSEFGCRVSQRKAYPAALLMCPPC